MILLGLTLLEWGGGGGSDPSPHPQQVNPLKKVPEISCVWIHGNFLLYPYETIFDRVNKRLNKLDKVARIEHTKINDMVYNIVEARFKKLLNFEVCKLYKVVQMDQ